MQGDRLEPDEVVARGHGGRDRRRPRRVVRDHLAGGPLAAADGARQQTSLVDLEPLQGLGGRACAGRAGALCEVGELQRKRKWLH